MAHLPTSSNFHSLDNNFNSLVGSTELKTIGFKPYKNIYPLYICVYV